MENIGCYIRVSSYGQNLEGQRQELQEYLDRLGLEADKWYEDKESGTRLDRPAFRRLQQDIVQGKIKTVLVYKLDRLSRKTRDGIVILNDWLERGVRIVSVTQGLDFTSAIGKLIAAILLAVAEMELDLRRERQDMGIKIAKANGVYKGSKKGRRKFNPQQAVVLYQAGVPVPQIARQMEIGETTVYRYLDEAALNDQPVADYIEKQLKRRDKVRKKLGWLNDPVVSVTTEPLPD